MVWFCSVWLGGLGRSASAAAAAPWLAGGGVGQGDGAAAAVVGEHGLLERAELVVAAPAGWLGGSDVVREDLFDEVEEGAFHALAGLGAHPAPAHEEVLVDELAEPLGTGGDLAELGRGAPAGLRWLVEEVVFVDEQQHGQRRSVFERDLAGEVLLPLLRAARGE